MKQIQFRPNISENDLNTKIKKIKSFLEKGFQVRLVISYKMREFNNKDYTPLLINKIIENLKGCGNVSVNGKTKGPQIIAVVNPSQI